MTSGFAEHQDVFHLCSCQESFYSGINCYKISGVFWSPQRWQVLLCNGFHVYQPWGASAGECIFIYKMKSGTLLKATILLSLRACAESSALHTKPGSQSVPAARIEKCDLFQSIHTLCWGCRADYSQQGLTADHSKRGTWISLKVKLQICSHSKVPPSTKKEHS